MENNITEKTRISLPVPIWVLVVVAVAGIISAFTYNRVSIDNVAVSLEKVDKKVDTHIEAEIEFKKELKDDLIKLEKHEIYLNVLEKYIKTLEDLTKDLKQDIKSLRTDEYK